ncbi:MAG TPA: hemerythrin domain-containing protein [Thermoleophilaceae bacterium]|nr:hemerythrin domain-containing protein [Thermoleophilaceae bacterium]
MPSIADQTVAQLGGAGSVFVRQRRDHQKLHELLGRLHRSTGKAQDEAIARVCRLVFTHAFAEESVLWPALRRELPDGEELTLRVEREHQEITEVFAALERSRRDSPERDELIERATALLDEDVRDEEDVLFPRLQEALTGRELRRLGAQWALVSRIAPTRTHPVVARRPPGNVLAALPLSAIDRTRDVLDDTARRAPAPAAAWGRRASGALAAVAGAVEWLPPLRRGEDPSTRPGRTELEGGR